MDYDKLDFIIAESCENIRKHFKELKPEHKEMVKNMLEEYTNNSS